MLSLSIIHDISASALLCGRCAGHQIAGSRARVVVLYVRRSTTRRLKKCTHVSMQGLAAVEHCSLAAQPAFTFWDLFYPWVLWYLIFYYLKGAQ